MPVKKGKLKPEDEYKIVEHFDYIKKNFDPSDGTTDILISLRVFELADDDFIRNSGENTARGRAERFLDILLNSGRDAYLLLITALNDSGYQYLAKKLEETVVPPAEKDPLAWIDELPEEIKNRRPSQGDCSRLSAAFGRGWELVFLVLGLSQAKIDQVMMNSHSTGVAISSLLIQWMQKNGRHATFLALLQALRTAENSTIDWHKVEEVIKD